MISLGVDFAFQKRESTHLAVVGNANPWATKFFNLAGGLSVAEQISLVLEVAELYACDIISFEHWHMTGLITEALRQRGWHRPISVYFYYDVKGYIRHYLREEYAKIPPYHLSDKQFSAAIAAYQPFREELWPQNPSLQTYPISLRQA